MRATKAKHTPKTIPAKSIATSFIVACPRILGSRGWLVLISTPLRLYHEGFHANLRTTRKTQKTPPKTSARQQRMAKAQSTQHAHPSTYACSSQALKHTRAFKSKKKYTRKNGPKTTKKGHASSPCSVCISSAPAPKKKKNRWTWS